MRIHTKEMGLPFHQILNRKQSPISIWMIFFDVTGNITQPHTQKLLCHLSNPNPFTTVLSCYEPIGSNYDSTDRHYNFSIRRALCWYQQFKRLFHIGNGTNENDRHAP
jgi:hypothetical protein